MTAPTPAAPTCDLHTHTTWSDGRWSTADLLTAARDRGVAAIAITDHDVLGGQDEALETAQSLGMGVLAGIELTATWQGRTIHVLGYGIDLANEELVAALSAAREDTDRHLSAVLDELKVQGVALDRGDLLALQSKYPSAKTAILHLVRQGTLRTLADPRRLLALAAREPRPLPAAAAIALVRNAGGVASLAHPATMFADRPLLSAGELAPLVRAGLDAIEVWQVVHGIAEREHYARVSDELGVLATGGSDCHGPKRGAPARVGSQTVPVRVFEEIAALVARRASGAGR
ncbi:MAG: PHP domain-containing protein [Chloroflexota bacterium]